MIYHFILNPKSGKKKLTHELDESIKNACQTRKLNYHIYYTTSGGDATNYVRSMVNSTQERQRFICVGGDGTFHEIVNSAPSNPNVEFGVIPGGSGNDFVRNFSDKHLFRDIDAQIDGEVISLDLIRVNHKYCVNMINIGFDCSVAREAVNLKNTKLVTPSISYILGVVVALCRKFGTQMKLIFDDGEVIERELLLTAIGNGQFCGGGFDAAPRALLNDGLMDVCYIDRVSRPLFISLVGCYKNGTFLQNPKAMRYIHYKQVPHFRMEFQEPIPLCIDGEVNGMKTIDFSVVRDALRFVVPKGCKMLFTDPSQFPHIITDDPVISKQTKTDG